MLKKKVLLFYIEIKTTLRVGDPLGGELQMEPLPFT